MGTLFHNILRAVASAMRRHDEALGRQETGSLRRRKCGSHELSLQPFGCDADPGGEDLEKRGEVYYDAKTGTYYIVPNAAGN